MPTVLHACAFEDNYIWLLQGDATNRVAVVDPGDAEPVLALLARNGLQLAAILCTHHHGDHVGGVEGLLSREPVPVYGPPARIGTVDHPVRDGERVDLDPIGLSLTAIEVPGHTRDHVAFVGEGLLFCGDTLFSAGCGRLFEGTPAQMHRSLARLAELPPDTAVYCGHEYTIGNLRFALAVEPDNPAAREHLRECERRRAQDRPTLPSTIGLERRINPFLRTSEPQVRAAAEARAGRWLPTEADVFGEIRRWKDVFRA